MENEFNFEPEDLEFEEFSNDLDEFDEFDEFGDRGKRSERVGWLGGWVVRWLGG